MTILGGVGVAQAMCKNL